MNLLVVPYIMRGKNLTMADYVAGQTYDLHTQGDPNGIGEYILDGVQPTVPADWHWVSPDLYGLVHSEVMSFHLLGLLR